MKYVFPGLPGSPVPRAARADRRAVGGVQVVRRPALGHEDDAEAVRVLDGHAVRRPVRVRGHDGRLLEPSDRPPHGLLVAEVQHEEGLRVRRRRAMRPAGAQLEMRAGPGDVEEDAVVAVVAAELGDHGQADAVAVERDDLVEALGVACDADLHAASVSPGARALLVPGPHATPDGTRRAPACGASRTPPGGWRSLTRRLRAGVGRQVRRLPGRLQPMGKLVRRTLGGDKTVVEWSPDDPDSVRAAAEAMRREVDAGYVAVKGGEGRNEPVDELPADADVVILTMPMGGG